MSNRTISFTRGQMDLVRRHADLLPPQWRRRFIDAVQDVLLCEEAPTDSDVQLVIDQLLKRMPRR